MVYSFKDINNTEMYNTNYVIFVTGPYNIFNNMVIDGFKNNSLDKSTVDVDSSLLEEFGIDQSDEMNTASSVDLDTFMHSVNIPSMSGKWFCSIDIANISKKNIEWLKEYIKRPNPNGILVLYSTEYKQYFSYLKNKNVIYGKNVGIIQLSFPNRDILYTIIAGMFNDRGFDIESRAVDLFMVRMSNSYDDYVSIIDKICVNNAPQNKTSENVLITYDMAFKALKGIENFVIDDFIIELTKPLSSDKPSGKKRVYRMLGYLIEEYGEKRLVNTLKIKISELIEFRYAINCGYIPILVKYNISEAKKLIGKESKISEKSDYTFMKLARIASMTSMTDWVYMKLMLMNVNKYDSNSYINALYALTSRSVLTNSRIDNDIGVANILNSELDVINKVMFIDQVEIKEDEKNGNSEKGETSSN